MDNKTIFKKLITDYSKLAYTENYIFGFIDRGNVYMIRCNAEVLPYVCCLDKASRGAGYALRFKPTKAQKEFLKANGELEVLCSEKFFNEMVSCYKYNKGEIFEKLVTENYGQDWKKDNVPFTKDGDITINEIAYQIKFNKATFANEKSLENLTKQR